MSFWRRPAGAWLLVGAAALGCAPPSFARETLGELKITEIYLEPSAYFRQSQRSSFQLQNSYLGLSWRFDERVSTYLELGSASLLGKPYFYGDERREFTITQGYGELNSDLGRGRLGVVKIPYGWESRYAEDQLPFPRSLIYQHRVVPRADLGLQYAVSNRGFYTEMAAHNGETGGPQDNQTWFTAKWGFRNKYGLDVGLSGMTGRTTPDSTADLSQTPPVSLSHSPNFDGLQDSRFRLLNFFGETLWDNLRIMVDVHAGMIRQQNEHPLRGGHIDLQYNWSERYDLLARYDEWSSASETPWTTARQYLLGAALKSLYRNSVLSLFATLDSSEGETNPAHGVQLVWKLTPSF